MGVRVKVAVTPATIRGIVEVRHKVFVEEDGYLPPQGGVISDFYDALPTTVNLVAKVGEEVVGGVRLTVDSEAGMPSDDFYPFRDRFPAGTPLISCSMLCLRRDARRKGRLLSGLLRMAIYWGHTQGVRYLCAPMNPKVSRIVERIGFEAIDEELVDPKGLPTLPMVLDMAKVTSSYAHFVERQDFGLWMDSFERGFYDEGEPIVVAGEPGREAFLVVEGTAAALDQQGQPVQTFDRGDVFGELALLTDKPRSSTVIASGPTDVMVLKKSTFERQMRINPELAMAMMRSIGDRFHDAVVGK